MNNVIHLINSVLSLPHSKHHWVMNGENITLGRDHFVSVHLLDDGEAVMIEHKANCAPCFFEIKNSHWLRLPIDGGHVQLLPKAISSSRVLFDVVVEHARRKWAM
jgi:hypothetical protein